MAPTIAEKSPIVALPETLIQAVKISPTAGSDSAAAIAEQELLSWKALKGILDARPEVRSQSLSKAKLHLFGEDKEPALTFYRDDSAWCPFGEYIWLALEEKQISYAVKKIHLQSYGKKPAWYYGIVPSGLVPAIEINGEIVGTESVDLLLSLEDKFPNHKPLLPAEGSPERNAVRDLIKLQQDLFSVWKENILKGWTNTDALESVLTRIDSALRNFGGPYFLGKEFSLVDAYHVSFLERAASVVPYYHGLNIVGTGRWPALEAWFQEMHSRPIYQAIRTDDFTNAHSHKRSFHPAELPGGAAFRAKIDGEDGSWDLPLKPIELPLGKDDGTGSNGAKEEAAKTLIYNHERVAEFASRGIKETAEAYKEITYSHDGIASKAVRQPEADEYRELVDLALQYVAEALLIGVENVGPLPTKFPKEVAVAAAYLRDRVGVPRDLTFAAARQLRAHLHWLVGLINTQTL